MQQKKHTVWCALLRHRPIFPGGCPPSIFGTNELNYCVRNGNRWTLAVINTDYIGDPRGIRTLVAGVRGRSLRPLDHRAGLVHHQGLEPGAR